MTPATSRLMGAEVTFELTLPVLRKGEDQGDPVVRRLQTMLNLWLDKASPGETPTPLKVDGDFGPATEHGVKSFQGNNGLRRDGVVGKQTWKTLTQRWLTQSAPG
jgi:peptidoglycan hydrolase-like protein with peptidoglycan-binding domain